MRTPMRKKHRLPPIAQQNLDSVARFEQQLLMQRPWIERVGESIAHFFGSAWFIAVQAVVMGGWIWWNLPIHGSRGAVLSRHAAFDPYPFPLLSLVVDVEFILLTTFVLMNQKHLARREEHWAQLHLQLSLLTEQEVTKNLQMIEAIARHLGVSSVHRDHQLAELSKPISVTALVGAISAAREQSAPAAESDAENT